MDIVDVFLARREAKRMCGDMLPQIDLAHIQAFEDSINATIATEAERIGLESVTTIEELIDKIKELELAISNN